MQLTGTLEAIERTTPGGLQTALMGASLTSASAGVAKLWDAMDNAGELKDAPNKMEYVISCLAPLQTALLGKSVFSVFISHSKLTLFSC